jgi:hypothetical protein
MKEQVRLGRLGFLEVNVIRMGHGAFKAMVAHKCHEQLDQVLEYGKELGKVVDIGWPEAWRLREFEVLG